MENTVEFFWEAKEGETEVIKNNEIVFNKLESAFIKCGWWLYEKVNRTSSDETHLHKLEVKKRFRIVTEAEKTK